MAGFGDKVGDAHIEIHAKLDQRSIAAAEAKLQKMVRDRSVAMRNAQSAEAKEKVASLKLVTNALKRHYGDQESLAKQASGRLVKIDRDAQRKMIAARNKIEKKRSKDGGVLRFGESLENLVSILPGQLEKLLRNPAIAAAAVAGGTHIAAGIGGAIVAGLGATTLAAGVGLAISGNVKFQKAGQELGKQLLTGMQEAALVLSPEIAKSFNFLEQSNFAKTLKADLASIFSDLRPALVPFISDLSAVFQKVVGGIRDLAPTFAPILKVLGDGFVAIADDVVAMFNDFKDNAPALQAGLKDLLGTVSNLINAFGKLTVGAAKAWETLKAPFSDATFKASEDGLKANSVQAGLYGQSLEEAAKKSPALRAELDKINAAVEHNAFNKQRAAAIAAGQTLDTYGRVVQDTTKEQKALNDVIKEHIRLEGEQANKVHDAINAQLEWTENEAHLKKVFSEGTKEISLRTPKARENLRVVNDQVAAAHAQAQKLRESGASADVANAKFRELTAKVIADTGAKGKNRAAIEGIIKKYGEFKDLPAEVRKQFRIDTNISELREMQGLIRSITGADVSVSRAGANLAKNRASGGLVSGPGSGTSDSIPANLSNGEFVVRAAAVKSIGLSTLVGMNASGSAPAGFASGGLAGAVRGAGRGASSSQVRQFNAATVLVTNLARAVTAATKALEGWTETAQQSTDQFSSFVNLGSLDAEGKSAGDVIRQLQQRKQKAGAFTKNLAALRGKGLSSQALAQIAGSGPDSPLAGLLAGGISQFDVGLINSLLGGGDAFGASIATSVKGAKPNVGPVAAKLAAARKRQAALKPVRAKGATVSRAGNRVFAALTAAEMKAQNLKAGTYVTVLIDGKEVTAIVKKDTARSVAQTTRRAKAGRR